MSKAEELRKRLRPFLADVLAGRDSRPLIHFLTVHSNLPGLEANAELAEALADEMAAYVDEKGALLWSVVATWADISAEQAPAGNPQEYLPICAAHCIGALGAGSQRWWLSALDRLRDLARDPRAFVREGAVFGLRRMLRADFLPAADELVDWVEGGNPLEMRAVGEAIAEPLLLTTEINAAAALALHRALIDTYVLLPFAWRNQPDYRNLRKTLASSLSVAVAALPEQGFETIQRWAAQHDSDLDWILLQNLTQARLANVYHVETEELLRQLKRKS